MNQLIFLADLLMMKPQNLHQEATKFFGTGEGKPLDFFRTFFGKSKVLIKLSMLPVTVSWAII